MHIIIVVSWLLCKYIIFWVGEGGRMKNMFYQSLESSRPKGIKCNLKILNPI